MNALSKKFFADADGKVAGFGRIDGREAAAIANDFTVKGASSASINIKKLKHIKIVAKKRGIPSPYPPTTFLLLYPFAKLPWPSALRLWSFLNVTMVVASSTENARTGASGSSGSFGSGPQVPNDVPCGKACVRNASK